MPWSVASCPVVGTFLAGTPAALRAVITAPITSTAVTSTAGARDSAVYVCDPDTRDETLVVNVDEYLRQFEEARDDLRRLGEAFSTHPYLPTRVKALRLFAQTAYFRGVVGDGQGGAGLSREECDTQVADLLAVLR